MTSLIVATVQHSNSADVTANLAKSIAGIEQAAAQGAQLVVLQELHRTVYFCQHEHTDEFDLAEPIPGPTSEILCSLAKKLNVVIVCSLFEKRAAGLYHNTAVVIERDGSIAGKYRKMHIPDDPGFYEKFYFTPGDLGFNPIQTSVGKLGVLICWDQWFPEAARLMALAGAELLIYPTAIGWNIEDDADEKQRQREAWVVSQRGHAIANGVFVIACNRVGLEHDPSGVLAGTHFWGHSFVAGPQGELLNVASEADDEVMLTELELSRSEHVRRWWPYLRDRRIDHYHDLVKLYRDPD